MTDKNKQLECVISSHKISKEEKLLKKHIDRRNEVKEALEMEYGNNLYSPFNSGSYAKNTAVNIKFDFDLMAPFKRNAFGSNGTLKDMYDSVHQFIYEKYNGKEATVRDQKVSIGIEFYPDGDGHIVNIDVVPGRELNLDQYKEDNKLNLYVKQKFGKIEAGSDYIRSNIQAQIDNIKDRANAEKDTIRKIIRLIKVWKIHKKPQLKSFFIELITIKAIDNKDVTGDLWERLKIVLEYIKDEVKTVLLPDPGNSANEVTDTLTDLEKSTLSDDMKYMIERIEENSDNIKMYFPINEKHPCEEDKKDDNKYGIKKDGVFVPPSVRFG
jgi:hypothetical protein